MKIELTQGKHAIVDEDLDTVEMLSGIAWQYDATTGYARNQKMFMHRMIALPDPGKQVDHINGDKLDNRRENLRAVTPTQNSWNAKPRCDNPTGYRGVRLDRRYNVYNAGWMQEGKWHHCGSFRNPVDAAVAADLWAIENRGEYAATNFLRYEE